MFGTSKLSNILIPLLIVGILWGLSIWLLVGILLHIVYVLLGILSMICIAWIIFVLSFTGPQ